MASTARPRATAAVALAAWTLFVWLTRVRNIVGDDDLGLGSQVLGLALSASFVVLAAFVLHAATRHRDRLGPTVLVLGGWTAVVWIVRTVDIASGGHSAGFVVVHLVLGVVSIALAGLAARTVVQWRGGSSVEAVQQ